MDGGDGMECLICQRATDSGCLVFCGEAICSDCEMRLMEQTIDDPGYETQVRAFRLLWQRQFLATRDRHLMDGDSV